MRLLNIILSVTCLSVAYVTSVFRVDSADLLRIYPNLELEIGKFLYYYFLSQILYINAHTPFPYILSVVENLEKLTSPFSNKEKEKKNDTS